MNEKRKRRRVDVAWIMRIPNRLGGQIQSRTLNVSASGIMFLSPQSYERNEMIPIELDVSTGCTLRVVIRIAREIPGSPRIHTYGAQFIRFADNGQNRLDETLEAISQRRSGAGRISPAGPQQAVAECEVPAKVKATADLNLDDRRWGPRAADSPGGATSHR